MKDIYAKRFMLIEDDHYTVEYIPTSGNHFKLVIRSDEFYTYEEIEKIIRCRLDSKFSLCDGVEVIYEQKCVLGGVSYYRKHEEVNTHLPSEE